VRLVLCDNALRDSAGHFFNLAAGLKDALAARGVPLAVWSHVDLPEALRAQLGAEPVFDVTPFVVHERQPRHRQLRAWLRSARRFRRALRRAAPRADDVLLVPSVRPGEILGLAAWLFGARPRPAAVVLNFMRDEAVAGRAPAPRRPLLPALHRVSFAVLRVAGRGSRLLLSTQSPGIAKRVGRAARREVHVLPMLKGYPPAPAREPAPPWTIGFLGSPRWDKGSAILLDVVDRCARSLPDCRIVVQLPAEWHRRPAPGWPANVVLVDAGLERARYFELFAQIDVIALPYDARLFGKRTSGVFAEAVACGCVTVVPAGTWMADMLAEGRGAGVVFRGRRPEAVAAAVQEAVAGLDRLRPLALAAREPWRASQGIGAFADRLLAALERD
jgi:glycosyltransferase involved in cell wall biosynthesis